MRMLTQPKKPTNLQFVGSSLDGSAVHCGHSQCNANDNFCRATGRKLSLARVLKKAELPKEERTKVWDAYRNMTAKKRW